MGKTRTHERTLFIGTLRYLKQHKYSCVGFTGAITDWFCFSVTIGYTCQVKSSICGMSITHNHDYW